MTLIEPEGRQINAKVRTVTRIAEIGAQDIILAVKSASTRRCRVVLVLGKRQMLVTVKTEFHGGISSSTPGLTNSGDLKALAQVTSLLITWRSNTLLQASLIRQRRSFHRGFVRHIEGKRISVAEIDVAKTPRIKCLSTALREAGFKGAYIPLLALTAREK